MGNDVSHRQRQALDHQEQNLDDEGCFVVPSHLPFTTAQLEILMRAGQQPGVPFRIGGAGAVRPQGDRKLAAIAENYVHIKRNSMSLLEDGRRSYTLRFVYDSTLPCKLTVYLGAKDKTNAHRIRIGSALQMWGPFQLPAGLDQEWVSRSEKCVAEEAMLPGIFSRPVHDCYDVVVLLDPQEALSARKKESKGDSDKARPEKSKRNLFTGSFLSSGADGQSPELSDREKGKSARKDALVHASFARVTSHAATATAPSCPVLAIQSQKVLLSSGVYVLLDIYGMDKKTTQTATQTRGATAAPSTETAEEPAEEMDIDAAECVICLTDPRSVAVFPCRHMCLCSTCAQALPSQGNKCPICRREASLLLRIPIREGYEGVVTPPTLPTPLPMTTLPSPGSALVPRYTVAPQNPDNE